ncbi:unnamed protein product [Peronospora destructor]|uniref:Apple domain-containing protein n=1 Tax=Peronospora destructor TaxID=86335 RepID=A0AAV0UC96_9STRA|nr:unnamed protein product [Peronospora destructor]
MPQRDTRVLLAAGAVAAVCVVPTTAGIQLVSGDACARDSTCTGWIWNNYNDGTCWLKIGAQFAEPAKWATNGGYAVSGNVKVQAPAGVQVPAGA